jgi:aminoglycoside phosphotransferase (APT) family kinase protein
MMTAADRIALLERELRAALGDTSISVRPWRAGLDYWADLACRGDDIIGVVRAPRQEILTTSFEGTVDFGAVLAKEVAVLRLLAQQSVPAPAVISWRRRGDEDGLSWMLCEYVEHEDGAELTPRLHRQLGQLASAIHAIRPRDPELDREQQWAPFVLGRLRERLAAARPYAEGLPTNRVLERAAEVVGARGDSAVSLLHQDLRAANLCVRDGRIAAVIDVANAIVGDPLFELARIRSYGLLTPEFCAGYGIGQKELSHWRGLLDIYEVDTAAMLTAVAVEEAGDIDLMNASRRRLVQLCEQIVHAGNERSPGLTGP